MAGSDIVPRLGETASIAPPGLAATRLLLVLSYLGFISLGLPDTVLGAAWPSMRAELGRPLDAAGALLLVTTAGVVLSSMLSGHVRARLRLGDVLALSTTLAAAALLATALAPSFYLVLLAAFFAGLGGGAIDACLNLYVARHHGARHMNWLHASWGVGAALAPTVVAAVLARGASWRLAYGLLGGIEVLLALAFARTHRRWPEGGAGAHSPALTDAGAPTPRAMGASVVFFLLYTGLEAGTGLWAASLLIETRGFSRAKAGAATAAYWAALAAGRFLIGVLADRLGPPAVLRASVWGALVATCALAAPGTSSELTLGALALLGLTLAPIFPLAMHDTPLRFGAEVGARLVGYQVAAASVGVATLPWLLGVTARAHTLAAIPPLWCALAAGLVVLERARRAH